MKIAYLCIFIAALMPYIFVAYARFSKRVTDNAAPRESLDKLEGNAKRAYYAHLNAFEVFPLFAIAVIVAHLAAVDSARITVLAVAFILSRIIYGFCYIFDKPTLRSAVFFAGFVCIVTLFIAAIFK